MDKVVNLMEEQVAHKMDSIMRRYPKCCQCDQCRRDIMAIALNHLKPRYVSTERGGAIARTDSMDFQHAVKIIEEIVKAIELVQEKPRHPVEESVFAK